LTLEKFQRQLTLALYRRDNVVGIHVARTYTEADLSVEVSLAAPKV
jgi:hypothetical protein